MEKRYRYEYADDWERLVDTKTGTVIEGHSLNVDDVFFLLGLGESLDMLEIYDQDEDENETGFDPYEGQYTFDC